MKTNILIVGAGLSGLALAYRLKKAGIQATILEAQDRIGGRIDTRYPETGGSLEMGATWFGTKHQALTALLKELGIGMQPQHMGEFAIYEAMSTSPPQLVSLPPNEEPSYRIAGGSDVLLRKLTNHLSPEQVKLGQKVQSVRLEGDQVVVDSNLASFQADQLIVSLPPKLWVESVETHPALPTDFLEVAKTTHTWMGESIKIALSYATPFWREPKQSGSIFSNVGPITEMYDHSSADGNSYGLMGFMNGAYHGASQAERKQLVLNQLDRYLGPDAANYLTYEEVVWRNQPFTFRPYEGFVLPHQNNGHATLRESYWEGKLRFSGSESSDSFPGYMEGAVRRATQLSQEFLDSST